MASRAKAQAAAELESSRPTVEEIHFRSDSAFLCLLVNHRTKFIRVIDFRAGALPAKRLFIQSVAKREGIEKVITLVEKDEVSSWTRVGFVREGTIPGFYKRSDGHLCGCVIGERTASIEVDDDGQRLAERTINAAKKIAKDVPERPKGVSIHEVDFEDLESARDHAWSHGVAINPLDPFGRDAERFYFECNVRRGKPNFISAEFQDCFGHSLVEILRAPATDGERTAVTAALRTMCEDLKERGIISAFGFGPSDDVELSAVYTAAGFRKTGLLAKAILVGGDEGVHKDAILWTQKLANPGAEDQE
jgi:hypothetical protein